MTLRAAALSLLALPLAAAPQETQTRDDEKIVHLLNRLTFGATPALVEEVRKQGVKAWLETQLRAGAPETESYAKTEKELETLGLSLKEILETCLPELRKANNPTADQKERREARLKMLAPSRDTLAWVLLRAVAGRNQVREVAADFFRNHFSVALDKDQVMLFFIPGWEKDVIHRHALGAFGDLLEATAHHPAMLYYLDNHLSRRPATPEELKALEARIRRRTGSEERADQAVELEKQRGLNENYARELLELHTLGVDNGYTQRDVIEVAECLTGWSLVRFNGSFRFERGLHSGGDKSVLGRTIKENRENPQQEGEQVLDLLKVHDRTAQFLSWKLCRWLVNDDPDEAMVRRVAKTFQHSKGDIAKVLLAIVEDAEFSNPRNFRAKFKRPFEYVVSALRVTQAEVNRPLGVEQALAGMSEPLYRCADPTGYYDQAEAWNDPGAMAPRWAFASDLVNGRIAGARIPPAFFQDLPEGRPKEWRALLVAKILPGAGAGPQTTASIDRAVDDELRKSPKASRERIGGTIVAMLLGSPEFQKQ